MRCNPDCFQDCTKCRLQRFRTRTDRGHQIARYGWELCRFHSQVAPHVATILSNRESPKKQEPSVDMLDWPLAAAALWMNTIFAVCNLVFETQRRVLP